jgi:hypothetical protein
VSQVVSVYLVSFFSLELGKLISLKRSANAKFDNINPKGVASEVKPGTSGKE